MAWGRDGIMQAYRSNRYAVADLQVDRRVGASSLPVVGGLWSAFKQTLRRVALYPEMALGAVGVQAGQTESLPESLKGEFAESPFGKAIAKEWAQNRQTAALTAQKWEAYMSLQIERGTQLAANAQFIENDRIHNTMPGENYGDSFSAAKATAAAVGIKSVESALTTAEALRPIPLPLTVDSPVAGRA